jgi:predicted DsbA family dithiol-disulfide isomerase
MAAMMQTVTAYADYLCPYTWRGSEVAAMVSGPLALRFDWRPFSMVQAGRRAGDPWQVWNIPIDDDDAHGNHGLQPFLAACAARRQDPDAFARFHLGLLRARHVDGAPLTRATSLSVAEAAGLQLARFERDLADPELRTCLAQEHHRAACRAVVGTPTFAFPDGQLVHLRVRDLPPGESEAIRLFDACRDVLDRFPYLEVLERPRPRRN